MHYWKRKALRSWNRKSSKHIRFIVSDTAQAARILEHNFHESHFSVQDDHNLRLHNLDLAVGEIVTAFVENGLVVSEAHTCEESLEEYFKRVTGGEELLKLVYCEFLKLKRKKFVLSNNSCGCTVSYFYDRICCERQFRI